MLEVFICKILMTFFETDFSSYECIINPLLGNVVKWSDTLLKSCSICCKIFKVCLTILRHCEVKG